MRYFFLFFFLIISSNSYSQDDTQELIISGIDAMFEKEFETSLELLTKALSQAEENNNPKQLFLATNNIGANYYSMLDYGEALNYYLKAYTIAIKDLEPINEMSALNNIAILYSKEKKFDKAEEYFTKAYNLAKENNENFNLIIYAINLGQVYNEQGQLDKAEGYLNEALELSKDTPRVLLETKLALANTYMLKGNYEESKDLSFKLVDSLEGAEYRDHKTALLLLISKTYQKENNLFEAEEYAKQAIDKDLNIENKIDVYNQLSSVYVDSGSFNKALQVKDSIIKYNDELFQIKNGRLYESNKVKFEIQNYQKELKEQQEEISTQKKTFYIILLSAFMIIILIGWALRNSYITNKQRKILHQRSQEILNLELEKEKTDNLLFEKLIKEKETKLLLEQEMLKNEIESKNRKLSAKALFISDRNNLVNSTINSLEETGSIKDEKIIKDHIRELKGILKTDTEWDSFVTHFEEVNQGFLSKLKQKHSNLNGNDLRYISYLYMNLSLKEISSILSITPEASRKRKERISKKLALTDSKQLYNYLSSV
tara:strand:+ start:290 stop:1921 length:1632 start_codon:yes stop_codon:yes gene_type:complete